MGFSDLVQDDLPRRPSAEVSFGIFYSTATVAHATLGMTTFAGNLLRTTILLNIENLHFYCGTQLLECFRNLCEYLDC